MISSNSEKFEPKMLGEDFQLISNIIWFEIQDNLDMWLAVNQTKTCAVAVQTSQCDIVLFCKGTYQLPKSLNIDFTDLNCLQANHMNSNEFETMDKSDN